MATLQYPTNAMLQQIERDFRPTLTLDDPIFQMLPIMDRDAYYQIWEQQDNITGLQQARGLDGSPPRVKPLGAKQYIVEPGVYGEYINILEREITVRRQYGSFNAPIDLSDIVIERQQQLMAREVARWRWMLWTLATTGTYTVLGAGGPVLHKDTFTLQTFTANPLWTSLSTATPLKDFRAVKLLGRGHSVDFGSGAVAFSNSTTTNLLLNNTNANDIFGRRGQYGQTFNTLMDNNNILALNNLPKIVDYDDGYVDDTGTFQLYIPNNVLVVFGRRQSGAKVGNLVLARNANNPGGGPGAYSKVVDLGETAVPRSLQVHKGSNPAPILWFPSSIVVMTVG